MDQVAVSFRREIISDRSGGGFRWPGRSDAPSRAEAWRALCELDGSQGQAFKQFLKLDAGQEEVLDYDETTRMATVEQRNKMEIGETIEVFGPYTDFFRQKLTYMSREIGRASCRERV